MYLAFRNINLGTLLKDLQQANYLWIVGALCVSTLANMSRAYRWGMLIEPFHKRPKFMNLFRSINSGYLANLAFPRLGEVTRCTALYEVEGVSIDALVGTVIVERILDVIILLVLIIGTTLSNVDKFGGYFMKLFGDKLNFVKSISALEAGVLVVVLGLIAGALFAARKKLFALPLSKKLIGLTAGLVNGFKSIFQLKNWKAFLFHSILIWTLYYFAGFVAFYALPETSGLGFSACLLVLVAGSIGMSAPVQGGFGTYHLMVASGLALYGVEKGLVYATIVHSSQVLLILIQGSMGILLLNFAKRKQLRDATA